MNLKPAHNAERERIPELVEDIGEDPARFLDDPHDERIPLARARIRGIDYFATLNAWLAIERRLNGGRRSIVDAIEERRADLEANGERERLDPAELERLHEESLPDLEDEVAPTWRHEGCGGTDVDRASSRDWYCNECEQRTNRVERVDELQEAEA